MSTRSTLVVTLSALLAACDCGGEGRPDAGAADADVDATLDAAPDATADAGTLPDAATSQDGGCQPPAPCEATDLDGDGAGAAPCGGDCNDSDPEIRPGLADPAGDGIDANCDGADGEDLDGDGFLALASGGDDCEDANATIHPLANDNQGWVVETVGAAGDSRPQGAIAVFVSWYDTRLQTPNGTCATLNRCYQLMRSFSWNGVNFGWTQTTPPDATSSLSDPTLLPSDCASPDMANFRFLGDFHHVTGGPIHSLQAGVAVPAGGSHADTILRRGWVSRGFWSW